MLILTNDYQQLLQLVTKTWR